MANSMKSIFKGIFSTRFDTQKMNITALVYRILFAVALLRSHGFPKLLNYQETLAHLPDISFGSEIFALYVIFTNVVCAVLIILGCFTRVAAFLILTVTVSGLLIIHHADPPKVQDIPLMYSLAFSLIMILGAGKHSVDSLIYDRLKTDKKKFRF